MIILGNARKALARSLSTGRVLRQNAQLAGFYEEEQLSMQKTVKKIIEEDINPFVDQWEAEGQYPAKQVMKKLGSVGLLGVNKPVEYGGMGLDFKYSVALNEEMGNVNCGAIPMSVAVQTDMATPALARFGSDALKREFLAPSIQGDVVACLGVSEPGAGSDVASSTTNAVRRGDDLIINGQKMWITNAFQADWICLLANTSEGPAHLNKSLICVPMNSPGIHLNKRIDKMGMRSSDTALIFFDDVRVPAANIIGDAGMGFTYQMLQFQEERLACAALALAPLDKCIKETAEYCRTRMAFGSPLLNNQTIHFKLAELQTEVEMLRATLYRATDLHVQGGDVTQLASMVKLKAGRLCREVTDSCLQFWGGMGFTNEVLISRMYRDLRLISIGGGADEVMLGIIAKTMGILPKPQKKQK
ncbi:probable acyl-CoA dehydrogenase 6 [Eurytemora carolleeae]|uniref:probable acyl-CoA dehydrogenase 6 n=1 Tax=Eurytemora carolleeae TaxID=1294199 RepID=UPI000C788C57|nr:probable acyl-CoA dehydrogenase 6 [Eurytemora carolleeae]|eukprot:XP_023339136.1 probable acyl-CoA dehydrogenase 6 [Eurytemora affinis]